MVGTRCRHMTEAMQARVVDVIAERLAVALAVMPQVCPKPGSEGEAAVSPIAVPTGGLVVHRDGAWTTLQPWARP